MSRIVALISIFTDCRNRLLRGSSEAQTAHRQPTTGTPVDVPVPRNVTSMGKGLYKGQPAPAGAADHLGRPLRLAPRYDLRWLRRYLVKPPPSRRRPSPDR